jgi:hypothetical protein
MAEIVIAVAAVVAAVGSIVSIQQQRKQAKKAQEFRERQFKAEQEARETDTARSKNQQAIERRRARREARIKRARIISQSELAGVGGSSGELGSTGVIRTNLGAVLANSAASNKAIEAINAKRNQAAGFAIAAQNELSKGPSLLGTVLQVGGNLAGSIAGSGFFGQVTNLSPTGGPRAGSNGPGGRPVIHGKGR